MSLYAYNRTVRVQYILLDTKIIIIEKYSLIILVFFLGAMA